MFFFPRVCCLQGQDRTFNSTQMRSEEMEIGERAEFPWELGKLLLVKHHVMCFKSKSNEVFVILLSNRGRSSQTEVQIRQRHSVKTEGKVIKLSESDTVMV